MFFVNVEVFRDILNVCPMVLGQEFDEPPTKEESLSFICELGHSGEINLLGTMRFDSMHEDTHVYGGILPKLMTNQAMLDSVAYKTYYAITSGTEPLKSKKPKMTSDSTMSFKETPSKKKPTKAKKMYLSKRSHLLNLASVKADKGKGVPDEQQRKTFGADKGTEEDDDEDDTEDDEGNHDGDDSDGNDDDDNDGHASNPKELYWLRDVGVIQRGKEMDWEFVGDQGLRLKTKDAPKDLEASPPHYK
nr:hypothetical protein [Tanacetum cinerariifolium]